MDKKAKKRIDLLNQRLQKLRQQLAGARKQMDDPADVKRLEREIEDVNSELEKLKQSG
jgi:archaellum component FlaC